MTNRTSLDAETIGQRIRRLRKSLGLSHDRFAAELGTSRSMVIRWEKDVHRPGPIYRERLADLTGEPEADFNEEEAAA